MTKYARMENYLRIVSVIAGLIFSMAAKAHPNEVASQQRPPASHKWVQQQIMKRGEKAVRKVDPVMVASWREFR